MTSNSFVKNDEDGELKVYYLVNIEVIINLERGKSHFHESPLLRLSAFPGFWISDNFFSHDTQFRLCS